MAWAGGGGGQTKIYPPETNLARWSLECEEGRQIWRYLDESDITTKQNELPSAYHVGNTAPSTSISRATSTVNDVLRNAITFFSTLQCTDGHWAGDYGGPMFLIPGYAIVMKAVGLEVPEPQRLELVRYLSNLQREDGGWGIHIESISTVFGTSLNYAAMRLLGVGARDPRILKARKWLEDHGGCLGVPSWGKFWLAVLGVFDWSGCHCLFPEMVLLPKWFPIHTARMWSYCRTVYMPMSYIYGVKFSCDTDDLIRELREEMIFEPYDKVDWVHARNYVHKIDLYTPHSWAMDAFYTFTNAYEVVAPRWIRRKALDWCYAVLEKEDEFTNYIDIGPVNKMINMLCVFLVKGKGSPEFAAHVDRIPDYFWMGRDGFKMNGTNGSQLWDTAFMVQGLIESGMKDEFKDVFKRAHDFVDVTQIRVDHPDHDTYFRDITKGGWPFSTRDIGWVVADCTGEGLKAALICKKHGYTETPLSDERLFDACNILLSMQNDTGGYATCEKTRGWHFFELFNASEVFGEIMIDYDYVECTSSAMQGLCLFREMYPGHRTVEVNRAIERALEWMLSIQRPDGSWEGMWGVCFTYGIWFGIDGVIDAGLPPTHPKVTAACAFLIDKQKEDGGWGETFMSCVTRGYVQHGRSQVVNTAWAVLALLKAKHPDQGAIRRGVQLLVQRQQSDGDWAQESISGVL